MNDAAIHHTSLDNLILLTRELINKIRTFGLKINPHKASLFRKNVTLLGHEINKTVLVYRKSIWIKFKHCLHQKRPNKFKPS